VRRLALRAGQYVLVLWAAATLNFLLPHLAPGDPINYRFGGGAGALTQDQRAELRAEFGLDGSLAEQYGAYWSGLASGDLGRSVSTSRPVAAVLAEKTPWTLLLVGVASAVSAVLGITAGVAAAWRRGRRTDTSLVGGLMLADAMPGFWVAMLLVAVFSVELGWLPSFGATSLTATGGLAAVAAVAEHLVLPVATIVIATVGSTFLLVRGAMLATLSEPYVAMAKAKGAPPRRVALRHALRNALLPLVTNLTLSLGVVLSGAVVVETVFAYPGLGRLIYEAVLARDYPLLQGAFLLTTVGVVGANLVADLVYPLLDPRVRRQASVVGR
jgi:peptide/nickel transport system permease protein